MYRINHILITSLNYLTMILFLAMLLIVFMQVVMRYFIGSSITGSEEAARYILFFLVLLGSSICVYEKSHLRIEYFYDKFSGYLKLLINILISCSVLISAFIFIYYGWELASKSMMQTTPSLQIPRGWIFMGFPVAGALFFFFQLQHLLNIRRGE